MLHMKQLRNLSARPELVVDARGVALTSKSNSDTSRVGIPGPFGNERLVSALPTNKAGGPQQLIPARVVHGADLYYLADPDGNLIGDRPAVWVHRMLSAGWVADTRRLAS